MPHFVGKIVLNSLLGTKIMEVENEKGIFIPLAPNEIILWGNELQLWFRAFAYRERKSRFTHFLMKFVPKNRIKSLSASQIEAFANHSIGAMIKDSKCEQKEDFDTSDYIKDNI